MSVCNGRAYAGEVPGTGGVGTACGAFSGFHAIIGTGTTPKMIDSERDILCIGYGGMLLEGVIVLVVLGFVMEDNLTRLNALKQILAFFINIAAAIFAFAGGNILSASNKYTLLRPFFEYLKTIVLQRFSAIYLPYRMPW